ncbi:hypothetical protein GALMADRAFT_831881 [Galerina marginata CBS 339.88]|uniref:Uncharacterized protein n=1 Tax=Galerina marginata (strain CBS 339.88) TaxID=685588 RepID=A0A067TH87_GALM3|nr:hypothetical protein GALMADRAFT_831881 [Galerina marginata CBS 339.88]
MNRATVVKKVPVGLSGNLNAGSDLSLPDMVVGGTFGFNRCFHQVCKVTRLSRRSMFGACLIVNNIYVISASYSGPLLLSSILDGGQ